MSEDVHVPPTTTEHFQAFLEVADRVALILLREKGIDPLAHMECEDYHQDRPGDLMQAFCPPYEESDGGVQFVLRSQWPSSGRLVGPGDVRHCTQHEVQPDSVAGLETAVHRLGAHAGRCHLPLGIVGIGVVDVPRDLAVNADRLDLAEEPVS